MENVKKVVVIPYEEWKEMTTGRGMKLSAVDTQPEKMNEQKHIVMMKVNMQKMKKKNQKKTEEKKKRKEMRNHIQKMMNPHTTLQLKKKKKNMKNNFIKFMGSGNDKSKAKQKKIIFAQKYANSLLMFIRDKNVVKWNYKGEILDQNVPLKKSNMKKLILHAISKKAEEPVGHKFFYNLLKNFKIPNYLLINNLKKYTSNEELSPWRPPGELYKKE